MNRTSSISLADEIHNKSLGYYNMTNIYLLVYPKLKAFKIGKADNVFNRADNIKKWWGEPDYNASLSLAIKSESVFNLERSLHFFLGQFSMNYSEGDGKTEFFSLDALSHAIDHINIFVKSNKPSTSLTKGINRPKINKNERTPKNETSFTISTTLEKKEL